MKCHSLYRVAQKECSTYDKKQKQKNKQTRDRMKKLCALLRIQFFSQQDDTKIVNFDEGVLILCSFSAAMSFSRFALLSQKSQFTYRQFSIVWFPRVNCQLLLMCNAKPAWIIKRSINYVTLQHYNPGELLKEIHPLFFFTSNVTFDTKGANLENYIASEELL